MLHMRRKAEIEIISDLTLSPKDDMQYREEGDAESSDSRMSSSGGSRLFQYVSEKLLESIPC